MSRSKIQLFVPCFIDQFYPDIARATWRILEHLGFEVIYPKQQTCCGQPAFNAGYLGEAKRVCQHFCKQFKSEIPIVVPSISCKAMIHTEFETLGIDTRFEVYELSEFLMKENYDSSQIEYQAKAVIHHSCTATRHHPTMKPIQKLLEKVRGLELMDYKNDLCCGFGGSFFLKHEPISVAMAQNKIESMDDFQADCIISADASCFLSLERGIQSLNKNIKLLHIAEILCPRQ